MLQAKLAEAEQARQLEEERARFEQEKARIELEEMKKQMQREAERQKKAFEDQQKQYEAKIKNDQNIDTIRQKMKDIRKDVAEANEIAKFMNKEICFTDIYVSKFDDNNVYSQGAKDLAEQMDEVQVKVENYDTGAIHIWSADRF